MKINLPDENGIFESYSLSGKVIPKAVIADDPARVIFSAAHVVADPFSPDNPSPTGAIDWDATMAFRRHLDSLGLGIAEAMDTAQRGMGLNWAGALELITRTKSELPDALVFNGCGTDHLLPDDASNIDDVRRAYFEQIEAIQKVDGRLILMASRALTRVATSPDDYVCVYADALARCEEPVILHWLGDMFDPALAGYWGSDSFDSAMETCLTIIGDNFEKIDGIKISLLDKDKEIAMRRRLPEGIKMYTGDDFNYPELIAGDEEGFSHALLGIFDPLAQVAAFAVNELSQQNTRGFHDALDPTVELARKIFQAPTQYYKTGVVFLAWLNGFQDHFIMLAGAQAMRPLPYYCDIFKLADDCGVLTDPELATERMKKLLSVYGA